MNPRSDSVKGPILYNTKNPGFRVSKRWHLILDKILLLLDTTFFGIEIYDNSLLMNTEI